MTTVRSHRVLSFDVYGTLIDWETGILTALKPLLTANDKLDHFHPSELLTTYSKFEVSQQKLHPTMLYHDLLASILPLFAHELDLQSPPPSRSDCVTFGSSIPLWPAFPDTVDALHRLQQHFRLVVLSNVDRDSFSKSNASALAGVKFDLVITAQDIGSYKPDLRNFKYMLDAVTREFEISGDTKAEVLQTAQSQFHDCRPAKELGLRSCWIERQGKVMGNVKEGEGVWDWRFETLGEMADAVEREAEEAKASGK